jgi:site-specific recombinase XerD
VKVQRKHESYLEPYRRHAQGCPVTSRSEMGKCQCPIWCYGRIDGRMMRLSCGTRSQDRAAVVMNRLLHPAKADAPAAGIADRANEGDDVSTVRAVKGFLESRRMRDTKEQSLANYERVLTSFANYCERYGVVALKGITSEHVVGFMQANKWKSATKFDRLVLMRSFFRFAMAMEWIVRDPAIKERVPSPKVPRRHARQPFTRDQIAKILGALDQVPEIERKQARALILLLLYSGVRISDATFLKRESVNLDTGLLKFTVIKTNRENTPIELHASVVQALKALPALDSPYFFLNSKEAAKGLEKQVACMRYRVGCVLDLAQVKGSAHVFRDTFAINLLAAGVDIFTVSQLLGHSNVKITQQHYLNFIPGYVERMSEATRKLDYGTRLKVA